MSLEHSSTLHEEIDRFCRTGDFQEALARAGNLLRENPLDRTARLYELLINVVLDGPAAHEAEVEQLRNYTDLSDAERKIIRKILVVCYDAAERAQDHGRMWSYQRLLRRLVLNQTLDFTIPRDEHAGSIKMPDDGPRNSSPGSPDEGAVGGPLGRLLRLLGVKLRGGIVARSGLLTVLLLALLVALAGFFTLREISWESQKVEEAPPATLPTDAIGGAPEVAIGELSARINNLDLDAVGAGKMRDFFERKTPELKTLYQARMRDVSGLAGELTVDLSIDGHGKITKIYESGATLIDFGFKKLIVDEMQKWQLPALQQGPVALSVVILFGAKTADEAARKAGLPAQTLPVTR